MAGQTNWEFDSFRFTHRAIDGRVVRLGYALTSTAGARIDFEETLELPASLVSPSPALDETVSRALAGLHLAAGVSYWKTCLPERLVVEGVPLGAEDAAFWTEVYTLGLGEFFFRNGIDPTGRVAFRGEGRTSQAPERTGTGPMLVLWGGGKDSVVSHEVLSAAGEPHDLLSIGRADWPWLRRSAEVAGARLHVVERRLDPKLFEMNAAGALNGHVPISAVLAAAGALIAALSGRSAVVASNESSASSGNATWHGLDVNHQWSKSLAFERSFSRWLRDNVGESVRYYSLLRPLTELRIVRAFATHPAYFETVASCNTTFRQKDAATRRFCLTCPKCVFVSLMARPWLDDAAYHALFGGDALADPANLAAVEELLGLRGTKPFECVGTPEEIAAAIYLARKHGRILPHGVMTAFAASPHGRAGDLDALSERVLARGSEHELPPARLAQLDAYLARH